MKGFTLAALRAAGLGGLLLALPVTSEAARFVIDGELTAAHDSNVSRARRDRDVLRDENLLLNAGAVLLTQPSYNTAFNLRGFVEAEQWLDLGTLDRSSFGGQAIGRWKLWPGYRAPMLQLTLASQVDNYDAEQRDSLVNSAQLSISQRANDRIHVTYGLEASERRSDGRAFDGTQGRVFLNGDFALDPFWSAYATYSYLRGDTFSSAQAAFCNGAPATDIYGLIDASKAFEADQALNEAACGKWIAYRIKADSHVLTLGANRAINHHLSADFSVTDAQVNGQGDNNYQRLIVRAGLLARF